MNHGLPVFQSGMVWSGFADLAAVAETVTVERMRHLLHTFGVLFISLFATVVWSVQPDHHTLRNLEAQLGKVGFNDMSHLLSDFDFHHNTLTYYALAQKFSNGTGVVRRLDAQEKIKAQIVALCAVECQVTTAHRWQTVPYLGTRRVYKFHILRDDGGQIAVFPEHHFWMMTLP